MPLLRHEILAVEGELGIWDIQEPESWFRDQLLLYPAELRQLSVLKGERRREWLAARQLVHQMSGRVERAPFIKDEFGKPRLEGSDWHISISHSHGLAAAIASPYSCGIDIQFIVPKITRLAHKFLRPEEAAVIEDDHRITQLHYYWGAKEALYKAYGRKQLEFIDHISVDPMDTGITTGQSGGRILKNESAQHYNLWYENSADGYMLVYGTEKNL